MFLEKWADSSALETIWKSAFGECKVDDGSDRVKERIKAGLDEEGGNGVEGAACVG